MEEDVVGFGDGEFLTDLSLTLVNSLKTLTSEHIDLLVEKFALSKQHNFISFTLRMFEYRSFIGD